MNLVLISLTLLIPCISCIDQSFGSTPFQQWVHNLNRDFKNQFEEQKNLLGSPFVSPDACSVVAHSEPCSKTETKKWYFHSKRNKCVQSNSKEYCMVDPNSFRNENECSKCEKKQTDVCMLPKYPGKCGKGVVKTKRFYFDSTSKSCKWFEFCSNGNGNNFETLKACEQKCAKKHKPKATEKLNQCFEASKKSSCTKSTSRFYFSLKQNRCVVEKNGCVSGRNAFESAKECVKKCPQIVVVSKKDRPAVCSSQPQKTSCRKQIEKTWYFDSRAGNCVQDIIISKKQEKINCVAGENAFFLQRDCEKKCQPQHTKKIKSSICQNPPSQASCALNKATSNEIRYYFDAKLKRCKPYTFCGDHSENSFKDGPTCRNKCYVTK